MKSRIQVQPYPPLPPFIPILIPQSLIPTAGPTCWPAAGSGSCCRCRWGCSVPRRRAWRPCSWDCRWQRQPWPFCWAGFGKARCRAGCPPSGSPCCWSICWRPGASGCRASPGRSGCCSAWACQQARGVAEQCRGWAGPGRGWARRLPWPGVLRHGLQSRARLSGPLALVRADGGSGGRATRGGRGRRSALGRAVAAVGGRLVRCLAADAEPRGLRAVRAGRRQRAAACPQFGPRLAGLRRLVSCRPPRRPTGKGRSLCPTRWARRWRRIARRWRCIPNNALYEAKLAEAYRAAGEPVGVPPGGGGRPAVGSAYPPPRQEAPGRVAEPPLAGPK